MEEEGRNRRKRAKLGGQKYEKKAEVRRLKLHKNKEVETMERRAET